MIKRVIFTVAIILYSACVWAGNWLPLGDSITVSPLNHSYRYYLQQTLTANSVPFDFIGTQQYQTYGGFDPDHEGHSGFEAGEILSALPGYLSSIAVPDVALIHLGHNDFFDGQTAANVASEIGSIIDLLQADNSSMTILLACIYPNYLGGTYNSIQQLNNTYLPALAANKSTSTSKVVYVDMQAAGFDPATMTEDNTHPNDAGNQVMAAAWYASWVEATAPTSTKYHIDPTVGTSGDGSASSPFKSWTNLPTMSTGDDVYFKCGTTYQPTARCNVTWGGTSGDRAIIGAYYMSGGSPVYGVSTARPILSGQTHTYPSRTSYHGMIHVISQDYVTIQDLDIEESGYYGIAIVGSILNYPSSYDNSAYFIVKNCKVYSSYGNGIMIANNPYNYGVVDGCEVGRSSEKSILYGSSLTGALTLASCPHAYTEVKNCTVHHTGGEGIGSNRVVANSTSVNSGYATIHDNLMYCNKQPSIYLDASEYNVVYNNLIFGFAPASQGPYHGITIDGRTWNGPGIHLNTENTRGGSVVPILADALNYNKVYNNLIVGTSAGIWLSSNHSLDEGGTLTMDGNEIYNNTVIGNRINIRIESKLADYTMTGNIIRNNISYIPADCVGSNTTDYSWVDSKITMDHNAWSSAIPTYVGDSGTDVVINPNFEKTSGWQALSAAIDASNFKLTSGSTAIDAGVAVTGLTEDYFGATRQSPHDIGAHDFGGTGEPEPPGPPSGCSEGTPTTDWEQTTTDSIQGQSSWPRGASGTVGKTGTLYGLALFVSSYTDPASELTLRYKKNSNDLSSGATEQVVSITATGELQIGLDTPLPVTSGDTLYIGWAETDGSVDLAVNSTSVTGDLTAIYGNGSLDWVLDQTEDKEHYIKTLICVPIESVSCSEVIDVQTTSLTTNTNILDSTPRGQTVTLEPAYYKSVSLQLTATVEGSLTCRIGNEGSVNLATYLDEVVLAIPVTGSIKRYKFPFTEPLWLSGTYAIGWIATSGTITRYKASGDVYGGGNGIYGSGAADWNMTGYSDQDWNLIFEKCSEGGQQEIRRLRPEAMIMF